MIPINNTKIIKKENSYIVNDYVDYLAIKTNNHISDNNLDIKTYNNKIELLDHIDQTFIEIWLNMNGKQQFVDLLTKPPFIIIPLYFLSSYYQIKFEFTANSNLGFEYYFYKDQHSNKIKQPEQINFESFRKTFKIIYNSTPISNNLNINLSFNIYPIELIWKYHDDTLVPESIEIDSHTNTVNTKYFTTIQPLLYHNLKNVYPNIAFYSFGLNPNSYKPDVENTTQFPISNISINNYYSQNMDKYSKTKVYLIGIIQK